MRTELRRRANDGIRIRNTMRAALTTTGVVALVPLTSLCTGLTIENCLAAL